MIARAPSPELARAHVAIVPLDQARLCVDCEAITAAHNGGCLRCGSQSLLSLASVLNRKGAPREFLSARFLDAMNDIGRYGFEKYGAESFQSRRASGDVSRGSLERNRSLVIADHAREHFSQYLSFIAHDHFHTDGHQLAAVAFNAMMEFVYAGLETEEAHDEVL